MKKTARALGLVIAAAALLSGCQTTDQSLGIQEGVSVTRFHLGGPIARGEIRIEPSNPTASSSLEFSQLSRAVERELTRLGWTVAPANARSEQVALVTINQGSREAMSRGSGISIGFGGGSGGYYGGGAAAGVSADIPVGGSAHQIIMTELAVRIQRRSDATVAWEGRAQMEARADSELGSPGAAMDRLAQALFQDFPGESGRTIRIR